MSFAITRRYRKDLQEMSLINFANVKNNMVSGASTDELEVIARNSMLRTPDIPGNLVSFLLEEEEDDVQLSDEVVAQMNSFESGEITASSKTQMNNYSTKFKTFLKSKGLPDTIETMPEKQLSDYLRYFYSSLRKVNGEFYSPATLGCIRAGIHRYLTNAPVLRTTNIISGDIFMSANNMLKALASRYLKEGGKEKRYNPIEESDMLKLREYFQRRSAEELQNEVIFNIIFFFGQRGREHLRLLKRHSIQFSTDAEGRNFAYISEGLPSKNRSASLKRSDYEDIKQARMYECKPSEICPLTSLKMYLGKLQELGIQDLFPKPTTTSFSAKAVRGKDWLGNFMVHLSKVVELSKRYTNHCIRVTVVSRLHDAGYNNSDIAAITGHKSETSVQRYVRYKSDNTLATFSNVHYVYYQITHR